MMRRCSTAVCAAVVVLSSLHFLAESAHAQVPAPGPDSVDVIPGSTYAAGTFRRWLLGAHYRDLWTTQIRVPVLSLDSFAGGLTPESAHAGSQTTSLRFSGADGRRYQFRRVFKTPTATLPEAFQGTLVADLIQDGASASNPVGTVVVSPLLEAAGVLHADPQLYIMPDDSQLGEFRSAFAGMLGTIEERPNEAEDGEGGFGSALQVIGPERLFERIDEGPQDQVDASAFLTARLVDILVGDRDRHRDNFRWALMEDTEPRLWRPISRDHDEAFVKLDGVALHLATRYYPQLVSFSGDYADPHNLNWHSREVDRRFLTGLDWSEWEAIALVVQRAITDDVIEGAVDRMPAAMVTIRGESLVQALKKRRDNLLDEAARYYSYLADEVEIHATNSDEIAEILRVDNEVVQVTLTGAAAGSAPYLTRRFKASETSEIRINMWGGQDRVVVRGPGTAPIKLRIVGGSGRDSLADSSEVGGVLFYDAGGHTTEVLSSASHLDDRAYDEWVGSDLDRYPPRQWGSWHRPFPVLSAGPEFGLLVGFASTHTRYGFRNAPFAREVTLSGAVATGDGWGKAGITADFRRSNSRLATVVEARFSGIDILRFHGFGNDSPIQGVASDHNVEINQFTFVTDAVLHAFEGLEAYAGPRLQYSSATNDEGGFFQTVSDTLYGSGRFGQVGLEAGLRLDRSKTAPGVGYGATVAGSFTPGLWDVESAYGSLRGVSRINANLGGALAPTVALRAGGELQFGDAPFQNAAYLGGRDNLRGWSSERFAGDALAFGSAELRFAIARFRLSLPAELGLVGFADVGRVYFDGDSPGGWHTGQGGGFWLAFLDRSNALTVMLAGGGDDGRKVLAGFGFSF